MNHDIKERCKKVEKEIQRISDYIVKENLFNEKKRGFLDLILKKTNKKKKEEEKMASFLFYYINFLGVYYYYSDAIKVGLFKELFSNYFDYPNDFIRNIPSEFKDAIMQKSFLYEEEHKKKLSNDLEKTHRLWCFVVGQQISCINRSISLNKDIDGKKYCQHSFLLLVRHTINIMNFITNSRFEDILSNHEDFFKSELEYNKKIEYKNKKNRIKKVSLINGYYNINWLKSEISEFCKKQSIEK